MFKGFVDVCVKICCKVSINRAGVAEIDEFLGVSAVSWCVSLLSEGVSEFPGLGVAGSIPALFFLVKGDVLLVRTAKSALCLERGCCFSNSYLMTLLHLSTFAAVTSLWLWQGGLSGLQVIDFVVISFEVHSILFSPGLISRRMPGVLFLYGYSGCLCCCQKK